MNSETVLDTKLAGDISGTFYVPSYQRGYRWGATEVTRLLDDISANGANNYCLQPVVVRRREKGYELIDGQQRLTTLYILLQYLQKEFKPRIKLKFDLIYDTREKSAEYLRNIDESLANTNIDYFHICRARKAIDEWFQRQPDDVTAADDIYGYLVKYVKIIWYETDETEDAISLFTRLNIGKIPLTSAELVKAMLLSRADHRAIDQDRQKEISLQWDNIEKELHDDSLWYFLTNRAGANYQTRIDLILNLFFAKAEDNRDPYFTFFAFDEMRKTDFPEDIWRKIQQTFLVLKDWYEDHELYHKIGYLIASGEQSLQDIFKLSKDKTKDDFYASLDELIRSSIDIKGNNYADLSYDNRQGYQHISRLLLLFNVESVRRNGEHTQWFPFDQFKFSSGGKVTWSLEHIHAQQSEGMRTQELWKEWLKLHIPSVEALGVEQAELLSAMQTASVKQPLRREEFEKLQNQVIQLLSAAGNTEYIHSISNLALLNVTDNAALNNSTFDVKRNAIIEMDKKGRYIPFCTRMVFLKYYTPSAENQLHFWGQADRVAYINAINKILYEDAGYLAEPISTEKEET